MISQLNKSTLYSLFNVNSFEYLYSSINDMAPSLVEYHLLNLSSNQEEVYLNKRNIQDSINIGDFSIYLDYESNIYLESFDLESETITESLW